MKFIVYRTSDGRFSNIKPCDEAVCAEREKYGVNRGNIWFTTWTVEIESLEALYEFCNKYGDVIIHPKQEYEEFPALEIYDSYREDTE